MWQAKPPQLMLHSIPESGCNGHFLARILGYEVQAMRPSKGPGPYLKCLGPKVF